MFVYLFSSGIVDSRAWVFLTYCQIVIDFASAYWLYDAADRFFLSFWTKVGEEALHYLLVASILWQKNHILKHAGFRASWLLVIIIIDLFYVGF